MHGTDRIKRVLANLVRMRIFQALEQKRHFVLETLRCPRIARIKLVVEKLEDELKILGAWRREYFWANLAIVVGFAKEVDKVLDGGHLPRLLANWPRVLLSLRRRITGSNTTLTNTRATMKIMRVETDIIIISYRAAAGPLSERAPKSAASDLRELAAG